MGGGGEGEKEKKEKKGEKKGQKKKEKNIGGGGRFNRPLNKGRTHNIIKNSNNHYSIKTNFRNTCQEGLNFSPGPHSHLYQRRIFTSLLQEN